jgi:hypothetical protein
MSDGYDFDSEADEGIFDDLERRSAGDKEARKDMQEDGFVMQVKFVPGEDGLPVPDLGELDLEGEPITVSWRDLLCLAGPCRWYTEVVQSAGDNAEGGELVEVHRWCGRLRTWAEQTSLDDARIFACTSFEPDPAGEPAEIAQAIAANALELANIRREAREQKVNLGVCAVGPCEDFVEIVRFPLVKSTEDIDRESLRFCTRLAGLGRLYDLRKNPVFACNAYRARGTGPSVSIATVKNAEALDKVHKKMAGETAKEEPADDHDQPE